MDTAFNLMLRRRLRVLGISQTEAAGQLGISRQGLGKILSGQTVKPELDLLVKLAGLLQLPENTLLQAALRSLPQAPRLLQPSVAGVAPVVADGIGFVRDVTVPDMSLIPAGSRFCKQWALQNTGGEVWRERRLRCVDDEIVIARRNADGGLEEMASTNLRPLQREITLPAVHPGEIVSPQVEFIAPAHPCVTLSMWKMVDADGAFCFPQMPGVWCLVKVYTL